MKAGFSRIFKAADLVVSVPRAYRRETGQALSVWVLMALINGAVQVIFRRHLDPGEFATLNSVLAAIALTAVPIVALRQALAFFPVGSEVVHASLFRDARSPVVQNLTLAWALIGVPILWLGLRLLHLPRSSIELLAVLNILVVLGAGICATSYEQLGRLRVWAFLLFISAVIRLVGAYYFTNAEPFAEFGLLAGAAAGLILLVPLLRQARFVLAWGKMSAVLRDRDFRRYLAATLSVVLGVFLFTNADRIVAQNWFGRSTDNNLGFVRWNLFDGYQTAGLLGRSLLWGTQPLLAVLLARRSARDRTERGDYVLLWIYLGALVAGAVALIVLDRPLTQFFGGPDPGATAYFVPGFAGAMVPLGLLQGVGIFALASRRYSECFTVGATGIIYAAFLAWFGKPQLMQSCMFSGGSAALLIVLFFGVVRWGRAQP